MVDPLAVSAIDAVLRAVSSSTACESGKWVWESAGSLIRRVAGHEVPAPMTAEDRAVVAQLIHDRVCGDAELALLWIRFVRRVPVPGRVRGRRVRFLPSVPQPFTGRQRALNLLDKEATRPFGGRPRLALLHGPKGIGLSTLAFHWGALRADEFPDGQLYVDLRTVVPEAALVVLLRQLGVPEEEMPSAADRQDLLRRRLADGRALVVLDHAKSAAQVRQLMVSGPGVVTLVVARRPFTGLGALNVPVGPLADRDARRLLTHLVGRPTVGAARAELPAVLDRCAGRPYALRAVAPRLTEFSSFPGTFAALEHDPVWSAAEDSYRLLEPDAARLYRLAGLSDWPALDAAMAACAADIDVADAARLLGQLDDGALVERAPDGRYRYRPAVREHAEEKAFATDGFVACRAAASRTVQRCLHVALAGAQAAQPESWRVPSAATPLFYACRGAGLAALIAEVLNLVQAVRVAEELGDRDTVILLCQALWSLQLKASHHDILLPALRIGVKAADSDFPGTRSAGALHAQLAHSLAELHLWDEAEAEVRAAVRDERSAGHTLGHASAMEFLGLLRTRQWRFEEAYGAFTEAYGILASCRLDAHLLRARALLERHQGRVLNKLGRSEEALTQVNHALSFFRSAKEDYNAARAHTDLAEILVERGEFAAAREQIDLAIPLLVKEEAAYHLTYLGVLRERCGG